MLRKIAIIVTLNAILVLFFAWTSYAIAYNLNNPPNTLLSVHSDFFGWISINHAGYLENGNYVPFGASTLMINYPFWLFFASTAINLGYIVKLLKEQEPKKK